MARSKSLSNRICHMNCPKIELVCAPDIQRQCTLQVVERGEELCRLCCGGACIPYVLLEPKNKITIFYLKEGAPGTRCVRGWTVATAVHTHTHTHATKRKFFRSVDWTLWSVIFAKKKKYQYQHCSRYVIAGYFFYSVALVRTRTIPTERPPPVGEVSANFCG